MLTELTINSWTALIFGGISILLCPTLCWIQAARIRQLYR